MAYFTAVILCVVIAVASARPQFSDNPFLQNQGFPSQNQGFSNQNQGFPNQNQGFSNQNVPNQFSNQNFPNQGFQNQNQGFPAQNQGFSNQNPSQFVPNPNNPFFSSTPASTRPTQGSFNPNQNQNQPIPTTQSPNAAATPPPSQTQSPAYLNCIRNVCMTTNEYNPVCGTDQVPYQNMRKLECANRCGEQLVPNWQAIGVFRNGACVSGSRVA